MDNNKPISVKVFPETRSDLRFIAGVTEETQQTIMDRLVKKERQKIEKKIKK